MKLSRAISVLFLLMSSVSTIYAGGPFYAYPQTGQNACYGATANCAGTGQDGELLKGAAIPNPRFTENLTGGVLDGTVTDNLTGLIWMKNANCFGGNRWDVAFAKVQGLASGACGLADGSLAGSWRLPSVIELESLVDLSRALPGAPFTGVKPSPYWTSTVSSQIKSQALSMNLSNGGTVESSQITDSAAISSYYVWPVRGGQ
jgi:hypothetical protein